MIGQCPSGKTGRQGAVGTISITHPHNLPNYLFLSHGSFLITP